MEKKNKSVRSKRSLPTDPEKGWRGSEEGYRAIVETALDGIYQVDTSGKFTFINESFASTFGYKREELLGKQFSSLLSAETLPRVVEMVEEVLHGKNVREEVPVQHKDGHEVPVSFSATPLRANGKIIGLTGILRDISERKWIEEALRESEVRFRELFENMSGGVAVYEAINEGQGFIFKDFNKACERIEKIERRYVIGKSVLDVFPGVKDFGLFEVFQRVWRTGNPEHHPISLYKDGRIAGWRENYVYKLPSGEIIAVYDDITKRKQSEEALRESEERYRVLVEGAGRAGEGIAILQDTEKREGAIVFVNDEFCRISGFSQEELLNKTAWNITSLGIGPEILDRYRRRQRGETLPSNYEVIGVRKDGTAVPAEVSLALTNWHGKIATVVYVRDVTERKRMEEELHRLSDAVRMSKDSIVISDLEGRIVEASEATLKMHGMDHKTDFVGKNALEIIAPEDREIVAEKVTKALAEGDRTTIEYHDMRKDGSKFLVEASISAMKDGNGKQTGFVVVARYANF